ncbi:Essential protein Yae1 N-terminal [Penicillium angulare]|uniref:Essential protein Yae1 N-terminal n=1 Tax=Penicillium angulare TaxID=116970 RepID=UPI0025411E48|nr:Essential protein Yae1 N-terminal [Penicillium angulare]KAJ5288636.1 Essential protein Yae1 N-terminal [Penicillium angulare]
MTSTHTGSSSGPSPPASPATTMTSTHTDDTTGHPAVDNSLDDIFGSSPPPESREHIQADNTTSANATSTSVEPSDLPSLRRQHVTAGYRDGVSVSKGERVQDGFDAAFPVGAQLGMRAGTVLGILEGLTRGLEERSASVVKKPTARGTTSSSATENGQAESVETRRERREKVLRVYEDSVKALDLQALFTGFEAAPASGSRVDTDSGEIQQNIEAGEKPEEQLRKKGDLVISEWEEKIAVPRWEENMEALEMKEKENQSQSQGDKGAVGERS